MFLKSCVSPLIMAPMRNIYNIRWDFEFSISLVLKGNKRPKKQSLIESIHHGGKKYGQK